MRWDKPPLRDERAHLLDSHVTQDRNGPFFRHSSSLPTRSLFPPPLVSTFIFLLSDSPSVHLPPLFCNSQLRRWLMSQILSRLLQICHKSLPTPSNIDQTGSRAVSGGAGLRQAAGGLIIRSDLQESLPPSSSSSHAGNNVFKTQAEAVRLAETKSASVSLRGRRMQAFYSDIPSSVRQSRSVEMFLSPK